MFISRPWVRKCCMIYPYHLHKQTSRKVNFLYFIFWIFSKLVSIEFIRFSFFPEYHNLNFWKRYILCKFFVFDFVCYDIHNFKETLQFWLKHFITWCKRRIVQLLNHFGHRFWTLLIICINLSTNLSTYFLFFSSLLIILEFILALLCFTILPTWQLSSPWSIALYPLFFFIFRFISILFHFIFNIFSLLPKMFSSNSKFPSALHQSVLHGSGQPISLCAGWKSWWAPAGKEAHYHFSFHESCNSIAICMATIVVEMKSWAYSNTSITNSSTWNACGHICSWCLRLVYSNYSQAIVPVFCNTTIISTPPVHHLEPREDSVVQLKEDVWLLGRFALPVTIVKNAGHMTEHWSDIRCPAPAQRCWCTNHVRSRSIIWTGGLEILQRTDWRPCFTCCRWPVVWLHNVVVQDVRRIFHLECRVRIFNRNQRLRALCQLEQLEDPAAEWVEAEVGIGIILKSRSCCLTHPKSSGSVATKICFLPSSCTTQRFKI